MTIMNQKPSAHPTAAEPLNTGDSIVLTCRQIAQLAEFCGLNFCEAHEFDGSTQVAVKFALQGDSGPGHYASLLGAPEEGSVFLDDAWPERQAGIEPSRVARCIGCGCTDHRACVSKGIPCHWLVVDYAVGQGVCSECESFIPKFGTQT